MKHHVLKTISWLVCTVNLACATGAAAQDLTVKSAPQSRAVVITNAKVFTVTDGVIEGGTVVLEGGKVSAVLRSGDGHSPPADAEVIDAKGMHLYPGLIGAYTQMGLTEVSAVRSTLDYAEVGSATPEARTISSVNPDSTLIPVTRQNGVLVCGVFPATNLSGQTVYFDGPGGIMPGRASVIRLDGWTYEDMAVLPEAGVVVNWPWARPITAWWMDKSEEDQRKETERSLEAIERFFAQAAAYHTAREADPALPADVRFDAVRAVLPDGVVRRSGNGTGGGSDVQRPVFILANDYDQIVSAAAFIARHGLEGVIVGGHDAPLCADLLKRHGISVLINGTFRFPKRDDAPYDDAYTLPARLEAAGVRWCLASGEETAHERNLPYAAAMAVSHGLSPELGLRSITLSAAQVLGVADRLGSIEPGKDATVFLCNGDVLDVRNSVERAWIDGRAIDLSSKQTRLAEKYREKYRQLKDGPRAGAGGR